MVEDVSREDRLRLLEWGLAASTEPILLVDSETQILAASGGAAALLGTSREALSGRRLSQFIFPPPDIAQFRLPSHRENGRPLEFELQHADGNLLPVEVYCDVFDDSQGRVHCFLVIHDIHRFKQYDEERTARLAKLSLLNQVNEALHSAQFTLDQILEAILICVTAGQGLRFNRAFMFLIQEQSKTLTGEIAIGPSDQAEAARIWSEVADKGHDLLQLVSRYDTSVRQTDVAVNEIVRRMRVPLGQEGHILIRAMRDRRPFRIGAQETGLEGIEDMRGWLGTSAFAVAPLVTRRGPVGVIVADNAISGRTITDLDLEFLQLFANNSANAIENSRLYHELERRLLDLRRAAQRQKEDQELMLRMERLSVMGETSAIVAHELRNPLVAIGGFARTLGRSLASNDPNRRYAEIITEEVGRLERIIHDLLDFIRPQKLLRKSVRADELVAETVRRYQDKMSEHGVTLTLTLQVPHLKIHVNPGEIQQVLQNLVLNALQAMAGGGELEVRTDVLEGGYRVEVRDEGPGLPNDILDRLFMPFFSTKATGSGLGLTICAQIIKAHGGEIHAGNRPAGGAVFSFILPLPKAPAREDADA
jgi:PAS domain S-box-containing protein